MMPAHVKLCDACAKLFEDAYYVKKIITPYSSRGAADPCEYCGKKVVLIDTYELTLKGRE